MIDKTNIKGTTMSFTKTIQMCIFDGNPGGHIMCELSNWNGRVYKISRTELNGFANRKDCNYTGVYFLFGKDEESNEIVYIGEAEETYYRIKQHLSDSEYWNDVVIVLSKDNNLNKAHVKYLENAFYKMAKQSHRFIVINKTVPTRSTVSEFDEAMLNEFIENAKLLVGTLGYKVFEEIESSVKNAKKKDFFYIKAARGANAKGILVTDGFAVIKGSHIAIETTKSMSDSLIKFREKLIQKGIVNSDHVFTTDYVFTSPSLAASIVMGRNANGRTEWKQENKMSIKDCEET